VKMTLIQKENIRSTLIRVPNSHLENAKNYILALIMVHGGKQVKESKRYTYFEVNADLLNRRRKTT